MPEALLRGAGPAQPCAMRSAHRPVTPARPEAAAEMARGDKNYWWKRAYPSMLPTTGRDEPGRSGSRKLGDLVAWRYCRRTQEDDHDA